jgi:ubiquinone/menaquinone biosynthesis C-methylase UbiE
MATNYDPIAEQYKRAKLHPWRLHMEYYTLFELVGDLTGKSVLDLACGEGFHTRFLKQKGASKVVGVDVSAGMIGLARQEEAHRPLGISYIVQDVKELRLDEQFDLVFAAYLLNYASSSEELLEMCQAIANHLKPGCRFVSVNSNPDYTGQTDSMRQYGFTCAASERREGTPIAWTFFLEEGPFEITNYYLSIATHERVLAAAGLRDTRWHPSRVSPQGLAEFGRDYWEAFLQHKPIIFIECAR